MTDSTNELAGKVPIVTGSARNIGRAIAIELAGAGASLIVNARQDREAAEGVASEIRDAGGHAIVAVADITDTDAVQGMVDTTVKAFGGIDILINNAAVRDTIPFEELTWEDWVGSRSVALDGSFIVSKAVVPHMIARGGGAIVGIGGMAATKGAPGRAHTMATKAGLGGLARGMALDLAKHGITSNIAVVGSFDTIREGSSSVEPVFNKGLKIPMGRKGVPQDMANLIRFLVGPAARYITGQTIHVNGGAYLTN